MKVVNWVKNLLKKMPLQRNLMRTAQQLMNRGFT
nr:MAG TPA: Protein of unknown function (DUF502) [Caudoviricetes sp.]